MEPLKPQDMGPREPALTPYQAILIAIVEKDLHALQVALKNHPTILHNPDRMHQKAMLQEALHAPGIHTERLVSGLKMSGMVPLYLTQNCVGPLHLAVCIGSLPMLHCLLQHGAPIDAQDWAGNTPLHLAAIRNEVAMGLSLIDDFKADTQIRNCAGKTALECAYENQHLDFYVQVWALLPGMVSALWRLALDQKDKWLIQALLKISSACDPMFSNGMSPLDEVVANQDAERIVLMVRGMIQHAGKPLRFGIFHQAAWLGHMPLWIALQNIYNLPGPNPKQMVHKPDNNGQTPLDIAMGEGHIPVVGYLLELMAPQDDPLWAPKSNFLHLAVYLCHISAVKFLLKTNPHLWDQRDARGRRPIDVAAKISGPDDMVDPMLDLWDPKINRLHRAVYRGDPKAVLDVLETAVGPGLIPIDSKTPRDKWTALQIAAQLGRADLVKCLLRAGASTKSKNGAGMTALQLAVCAGDLDLVCFLYKADPSVLNEKNHDKETALDMAIRYQHTAIAQALKEKGAKGQPVTETEVAKNQFLFDTPKPRALKKKKASKKIGAIPQKPVGDPIEPRTGSEATGLLPCPTYPALHLVLEASQPEAIAAWLRAVEKWLSEIPDPQNAVNEPDLEGMTLLHYIPMVWAYTRCMGFSDPQPLHVQTEDLTSERFVAIQSLLIQHGADPEQPDDWKVTPLQRAAIHGWTAGIRLLLSRGVSVHTHDVQGFTPLHAAAGSGNPEAVCCLLAHGANLQACNASGYTPLDVAKALAHQAVVELLESGLPLQNHADRQGLLDLYRHRKTAHKPNSLAFHHANTRSYPSQPSR